jgi:signal peptidase I
MAPTLADGDHLLVVGLLRWRVGDLVALDDPERPGLVLVKRVVSLGRRGIEVGGDNSVASRDSRAFGPVRPDAILGRAVYRYYPSERTGRLSRGRSDAHDSPPTHGVSPP